MRPDAAVSIDHCDLPDIASARLPDRYSTARRALADCQRLDECKDWSDRAAALASYARQADDDHLEKLAMKIRARAIRRCGELLREIEPAHGANQNIADGTVPNVLTRTQAAREAGLSERQQKTALRVASVSDGKFDAMVDGEHPATITELAEAGTGKRPARNVVDLKGRDPDEYNRAFHFCATITEYAQELAGKDIEPIVAALDDHERDGLRAAIDEIAGLHDRIMTGICGDRPKTSAGRLL